MKTGYACYKFYVAMKLHLTQDKYNFVEKHGRTKVSLESFEKRPDSFFFDTIAKRKDPFGYIFANLIAEPKRHISQFKSDDYDRYKKIHSSLKFSFKEDLNKIGPMPDAIKADNGNSKLFSMYLGGEVEIETLAILDKYYDIVKYWKKHLSAVFLFEDDLRIIHKYTDFIDIDENFVYENVRNTINNIDH